MLGFMTKNGKKERAEETDEGTVAAQTPVVKVIELIGTSSESFDDAIGKAITLAGNSLHGISGADVKHMTIGVRDGEITQYRVTLKVAFAIDDEDDD